MCVIVDMCCIPHVFDKRSKSHSDFSPLLAWIDGDSGRLLIGGTKYKKELRTMVKYFGVFLNYEKQHKLVRLDDAAVDLFAKIAKRGERSQRFNDEHIVAMVAVSGCKVVCTNDKEAMPFIRKKDLYKQSPYGPPKIYNKSSHKHLCCKDHVVAACKRKN